VTPPSRYTDLNQHDANLDHPHAYYNRGYFYEPLRLGTVLDGDWDYANLELSSLLEYKALEDVILNGKHWSDSQFAKRGENYIKLGYSSKGFTNAEQFLREREQQIIDLIESIKTHGVQPTPKSIFDEKVFDQISVNVARDGKLLFNNRGLHRLSIAKIVGVEKIPISVVVWHSKWVQRMGFQVVEVNE